MEEAVIDQETLDSIDRYLEQPRRSLRLPGLSVAIVHNGRVAYLRGLGKAAPGRAMTAQTPLIIGSLSKSFTALAVMQLVEAGQIELDAPVQRYIPWFRLADPAVSALITLRHLLTHTSGISRYAGRALLSGRGGKTIEQSVRELATLKLSRPVGATFQYSNTNYLIAGLVIEVVSGQPFGAYVQQHIFTPLGMQHSFTSEQETIQGDLASGYRWWFGVPRPFHAPYLDDALPAAFLMASAEDMARWLLVHLHSGAVNDISVLSPTGIEELHQPQVPTGKKNQYAAMGWRVGQIGGESVIQHGGEVSNFRADMIIIPDQHIGLVTLANSNNGLVAQLGLDQIAPNIVRLLFNQPLAKTRLTLRSFAILEGAVLLALIGLAIWLWLALLSAPHVAPGGLVTLILAITLPLVALWRLPKTADMPWAGLKLYVPDLGNFVWWISIISFLLAGVTLLRWLI